MTQALGLNLGLNVRHAWLSQRRKDDTTSKLHVRELYACVVLYTSAV